MSSSNDTLYTAQSESSTPQHKTVDIAKNASSDTVSWCRERLRPLETSMDINAFLEMLFSFNQPSDTQNIVEIVHEAIGQNFGVVNPHDFARDYIKRRHHDKKFLGPPQIPPPPANSAYYNYLNRMQQAGMDADFVEVKNKKKKKQEAAKESGAPVGVGGRHVVGMSSPRQSYK